MKAEYVNSFFAATQDVFRLMLDLEVKRGDLKVIEGLTSSKDANIILGVTGDLKGTVFFSFPKDMTLKMVNIMAGMEMDEIDVFVSSALGEVANIIGGNAITNLTNYNYICDITPPQIIVGQHKSISMANEKALVIPMETEIGEFDIAIFLPEN
ncbi:chemotaxis protein CheX [Wansuia hejianensis]|uniref:Chemotaxis protein CheX n=1 Tax=Wansuia hejianensis TaxID=2763667 RepID=A0A926IMQ4_9FIRM|nr:chemotaxis protein CheX [Wansuia hejianensis]MBC8591434.1 chemotaxis protein CheX [Wansuia hejianensis]